MKKSLFILSFLCLATVAVAQDYEMWPDEMSVSDEVSSSDEIKGAHPYKLEENEQVADSFAHWSIIPHLGFSSFDGDFTSEMMYSVAVPSAGLAVEYNFTPVWNVGVEYLYDMYTVTGKLGNADTLLNGHMHKAGGYLSMDVINLFFPRAKKKILSVIPQVGGGAAFYKRSKYYMDDKYVDPKTGITHNETHGRGNTLNYINADGVVGPDHDEDYTLMGYVQAGVNFDFNLNRSLALGLRANYTYFTRDYVDGRGYHKQSTSSYASKNNDGIFDITLNLRFKLEAVKKTHVRNISSFDTWENEAPPVHDTLIIKHDSVIIRETIKQQHFERAKDREQYYYVYFANGKANIDDKGLITIQQVADRLMDDTTLYAVITGFCDNTGSNSLNYTLGDKRAANVLDELVSEYAIDTTRMFAGGVGKITGRRSTAAYGPNRRASIRLVDKATFERLRNNLNDQKEQRVITHETESGIKTIPLSESARPEKVNEYLQRSSEEVAVEATTTLSKLARKYYNNTYCWVYIYMANRDKISNPNALTPGISLVIPELTQQEMRITKDQSLVIYGNARQNK